MLRLLLARNPQPALPPQTVNGKLSLPRSAFPRALPMNVCERACACWKALARAHSGVCAWIAPQCSHAYTHTHNTGKVRLAHVAFCRLRHRHSRLLSGPCVRVRAGVRVVSRVCERERARDSSLPVPPQPLPISLYPPSRPIHPPPPLPHPSSHSRPRAHTSFSLRIYTHIYSCPPTLSHTPQQPALSLSHTHMHSFKHTLSSHSLTHMRWVWIRRG